MCIVPVAFWWGQHTWKQPHCFVGASLWTSTQQCLDVEQEEIWLKEGTFYVPISNKREQLLSFFNAFPRCHHHEYSDHDCGHV